jgi:general secretion pathway protein L
VTRAYIFIDSFDDMDDPSLHQGLRSLVLDNAGKVLETLATRSLTELQALTLKTPTLIVLSTQFVNLYRVNLPWLSDKKARTALPFALEEDMAEPIETIHIAFDKAFYQNNQYLIAVCHQDHFRHLINRLNQANIRYQGITIDWFALKPHEIIIQQQGLLVHDDSFEGAIPADLIPQSLKQLNFDGMQCVYFEETTKPAYAPNAAQHDESESLFIAQRLHHASWINLCQGTYRLTQSSENNKRWTQAATLLGILFVLGLIFSPLVLLIRLNHAINPLDHQIATRYHAFFPEAKQVVSPKFRITQALESSQSQGNPAFWTLWRIVGEVFKEQRFTLIKAQFQQNTLILQLSTTEFSSLQAIESALTQKNIKVKQTEASTQKTEVIATLELSL